MEMNSAQGIASGDPLSLRALPPPGSTIALNKLESSRAFGSRP
jgi:hypothetical protein